MTSEEHWKIFTLVALTNALSLTVSGMWYSRVIPDIRSENGAEAISHVSIGGLTEYFVDVAPESGIDFPIWRLMSAGSKFGVSIDAAYYFKDSSDTSRPTDFTVAVSGEDRSKLSLRCSTFSRNGSSSDIFQLEFFPPPTAGEELISSREANSISTYIDLDFDGKFDVMKISHTRSAYILVNHRWTEVKKLQYKTGAYIAEAENDGVLSNFIFVRGKWAHVE